MVRVLLVIVISLIIFLFLAGYNFNRHKKEPPLVRYLVIPPALGYSPDTPQKLYSSISFLLRSKSRYFSLSKRKVVLEVISSKAQGISFIISCSVEISDALKSILISYWPKLEIKKIREGCGIVFDDKSDYCLSSWRPNGEFSDFSDSSDESALSFLLGSMSGLKKNELIGLQLVLQANHSSVFKKFNKTVLAIIKSLAILIRFLIIDLISGTGLANNRISKHIKPKQLDVSLEVSIRTITGSLDSKRLKTLNMTVNTAVRGYGLVPKGLISPKMYHFINQDSFGASHISIEYLSRLYYFPSPNSYLKEDVVLSRSTTLPTPVAVKNRTRPSVVIGQSINNEDQHLIGLTASERQKHMLIIGGTGMGKSTILGYSLIQDMLSNKGLALIDPHGDLAKEIIGYVPTRRLDDVIYLDPADISHPIGINLMELPKSLNSEDLEIAKDLITESIVSIFRKLFSDDDSGGHRIEYVLRNTIHTAFSVPDATLFTIHKLLTNDLFRASIVSSLEDGSLRDFWYGEFNKAGSYQKVKMISGVTAKLGRFQRSVVTKRIIEQTSSTIDFNDVINHRKILIGNFSKGSIGEDTSSLLSMLVLAKLQLSAWQRSLIAKTKQAPFYLYVDEFQNFSSTMFSQLISESRKFGINLVLAEQTTAYQEENEINILLANVGNVICFKTASELDAKRLGPLFEPYVNKYALNNLKPYNFYMRLSSESTQEPLSGTTLLIQAKPKQRISNRVISISRLNNSLPYIVKAANNSAEKPVRVPMKK